MKNFQHIYKKVMSKLESNLAPWLKYHSSEHTKYVLAKAILIADKEGISGEELCLLKIAALYHDTGFMISPKNHEAISCEIAKKELKEFGLKSDEISTICGMILATKIPQQPTNKLERIIADADLEYLGTDRFIEFGNRLYEELLHEIPDLNLEQWNEIQYNFISKHHYHTDFCKQHRKQKKLENLEMLKESFRKSS